MWKDARWLRTHVGKVGFLQLGWAYQGSMFLCEVSTEWYERYQRLLEMSEDLRAASLSTNRTRTTRASRALGLAAEEPGQGAGPGGIAFMTCLHFFPAL